MLSKEDGRRSGATRTRGVNANDKSDPCYIFPCPWMLTIVLGHKNVGCNTNNANNEQRGILDLCVTDMSEDASIHVDWKIQHYQWQTRSI